MWVPNSCSSLCIRVSWHFSEQITCPGGHKDWQFKQKISMRSVNSKSFSGECCWPWSKSEETGEQEPTWPRHDVLPATIPRYLGSQGFIRPQARHCVREGALILCGYDAGYEITRKITPPQYPEYPHAPKNGAHHRLKLTRTRVQR